MVSSNDPYLAWVANQPCSEETKEVLRKFHAGDRIHTIDGVFYVIAIGDVDDTAVIIVSDLDPEVDLELASDESHCFVLSSEAVKRLTRVEES